MIQLLLNWLFPDHTSRILLENGWEQFGNCYFKDKIKIKKLHGYYVMNHIFVEELTLDILINSPDDIIFSINKLEEKLDKFNMVIQKALYDMFWIRVKKDLHK